MARLIAQGLTSALGQRVIVDNRGGIFGTETLTRAAPDGYTVLLQGSVLWLLPFMRDNVPWDPVRDFSPVTLATSSPNVVVAHPSVPAQSIKELISLAKARPGNLNYAIGGLGSTPHLATELFRSMTGIDMVRINYMGGGAAFNDLIGGQVQLMFPTAGAATPPYCPTNQTKPAVDFRHGFRAAAAFVSANGRVWLGLSPPADRHRVSPRREPAAQGAVARQTHPLH